MLTAPYISIAAQLRANVSGLKHIDLYYQQYLNAEAKKNHPYNTPAVFIEYGDCDWVEQGKYIQEAETTFTLHCVSDMYTDTMNIDTFDSGKQAAKLEPLSLDTLVHAAIQTFLPDGCCREMWRIHTAYDRDHDQLTVIKITYSCRLIEDIRQSQSLALVTSVGVTGTLVPELTETPVTEPFPTLEVED